MLNKDQKSTIIAYIDLHKEDVKKHLRHMQMLNNNGTLKDWDDHKGITDWFLNAINQDNYEVEGDTAYLEVSGFNSYDGNPKLFDFPAAEFNLV